MSTLGGQNKYQTPEELPLHQRIKVFWLKYGEKVVLAVGIILIALVSFEAGFLKGQQKQNEPIEVNQVACAPCSGAEESADSFLDNTAAQQTPQSKTDIQPNIDSQKCAFVASKNSNKYHLTTCPFAQKIKPENRVCFSSKEEAENKGYQGAKCCIK